MNCAECNKEYVTAYRVAKDRQRFCSHKCRQRNAYRRWYAVHGEEERARARAKSISLRPRIWQVADELDAEMKKGDVHAAAQHEQGSTRIVLYYEDGWRGASLKLQEALAYLNWLRTGHEGRHNDFRTAQITKTL